MSRNDRPFAALAVKDVAARSQREVDDTDELKEEEEQEDKGFCCVAADVIRVQPGRYTVGLRGN